MMAEGDGEVKREAVEAGAGRRRGGAAGPGGGLPRVSALSSAKAVKLG